MEISRLADDAPAYLDLDALVAIEPVRTTGETWSLVEPEVAA